MQGSNPGLPHCRQILYQLSHQGSPRRLEWEPIPSPADLPNPEIELGSPDTYTYIPSFLDFLPIWVTADHWVEFPALHSRFLLLLLLLSRFSRVRLCATPQMAAHQAPLSLGFSRQEHWVAISFSNAWKWKVKVKSLSRVWLLASPWTAANQALPSMGFSRQEYWSGVHCSY